MRRCPKCGFLLNENDRYCENCGEDCSAVEDYETAETVSLNEPKNEQKEKLKKQWKIAGIVFGAFVLVFAGILALVLFPLNNSSHSDTKTNTKSEISLTEPTTVEEGIVPLNESVVEESSNDTGARVKYDFYGFWKKYKSICVSRLSSSESDSNKYDNVKQAVDILSDVSNYDIDNGNQERTNTATKLYTPKDLSRMNIVIGTEQYSGKIMNVSAILSDTSLKTNATLCIAIMCNVSLEDAANLLNESLNKVANDQNTLSVYNNICFSYKTPGDILTLYLLAASDKFINEMSEKSNIVYLDTNYSAAEPTTAKSDKSDSSYDDYNDYDDYYDDDYILPDSGTRKLTNSDLAGLDADELELARNEIYARAGRRFNTDYIQDYFDDKWWYVGTIEPEAFTEDMLNDVEKYNVNFIRNYEKKYAE